MNEESKENLLDHIEDDHVFLTQHPPAVNQEEAIRIEKPQNENVKSHYSSPK